MYELWKFFLDKIVGMLCIIALLPFFLVIAIVIKISSYGPILLKQMRIGKNGRPFTIYKFRTMVIDLDTRIHRIYVTKLINGAYGKIGEQPIFKLENDPRITPFGRFLRKTCLDEIPQLINVIRGEMSLVGPRPSIPYEFEEYQEWHKERLNVKPGMTGLWQVTGRNTTTFDEMVRLDLIYVKNRSILLELKILLKTLCLYISGKGAY